MSWTIDIDAVAAARADLNLAYPVRITRHAGRTLLGRYSGLSDVTPRGARLNSPHHHISLKSAGLADRLCRTLLHEMTHAAQLERLLRADLPESERVTAEMPLVRGGGT